MSEKGKNLPHLSAAKEGPFKNIMSRYRAVSYFPSTREKSAVNKIEGGVRGVRKTQTAYVTKNRNNASRFAKIPNL